MIEEENDWAHHHVILILAEWLGREPSSISPSDRFAALFSDSLSVVEFVMGLEEKFDLPDSPDSLETVQDLIDLIRKRDK